MTLWGVIPSRTPCSTNAASERTSQIVLLYTTLHYIIRVVYRLSSIFLFELGVKVFFVFVWSYIFACLGLDYRKHWCSAAVSLVITVSCLRVYTWNKRVWWWWW